MGLSADSAYSHIEQTMASILRIRSLPFFAPMTVLAVSCLASLALIEARQLFFQKYQYRFLVWNLFLAVIPLGIAYVAFVYYELRRRKMDVLFLLLLITWLLFFPNAPYIVTDFVHLKAKKGVPIWFDIVLLYSFSWNGLLAGLFSLRIMHLVISDRLNRFIGWLFVLAVLPLASFGIYLGRFQRWNSWDVVDNPRSLLVDSLKLLQTSPSDFHMATILALISLGLLLGYVMLVSVATMRYDKGEP